MCLLFVCKTSIRWAYSGLKRKDFSKVRQILVQHYLPVLLEKYEQKTCPSSLNVDKSQISQATDI